MNVSYVIRIKILSFIDLRQEKVFNPFLCFCYFKEDIFRYGDSISYGIDKFKSLNINVNLYGHTKKIDDAELRKHFMMLEEGIKMVTAMGIYKRYERARESIVNFEGVKWFMSVIRT